MTMKYNIAPTLRKKENETIAMTPALAELAVDLSNIKTLPPLSPMEELQTLAKAIVLLHTMPVLTETQVKLNEWPVI